jgi:glycosyltransferase involved in cell wall biosynthesis
MKINLEKNLPQVTVIITTYNYGKFIQEAIDSVLASNYPQDLIEVLVIDDGSTDDTANLVKSYSKKVNYIYTQNTRKAGALALGIELAQGKYIFNLDADDLFENAKIRKVVDIFENDSEITHVSHRNNRWNVKTDTKKPEEIPPKLLNRKVSGHEVLTYFYSRRIVYGGGSTYAARAKTIKGKLYINQDMGTVVDEYLTVATISLGYSYFIAQPLTLYRRHGVNVTQLEDDRGNRNLDKLQVRVACTRAIQQELSKSDFLNKEIKALYTLKTKTYILSYRKLAGNASIGDVLDLGIFLMKNMNLFWKNFLIIVWSYNLPKYLIPSLLFRLMRQLLKKKIPQMLKMIIGHKLREAEKSQELY